MKSLRKLTLTQETLRNLTRRNQTEVGETYAGNPDVDAKFLHLPATAGVMGMPIGASAIARSPTRPFQVWRFFLVP